MKTFKMVVVMMVIFTTPLLAQSPNASPQAIKAKLKTELKFSDFEADSLMSIMTIDEADSTRMSKDVKLTGQQKKSERDQQLWIRRERMKTLIVESEIPRVEALYYRIKRGN